MSIGAVSLYKYSGNYTYDPTGQYKYFGMVIPSDRLEMLMRRYGIQETGDPDKDLEALYKAMYPQAAKQAQLQSSFVNGQKHTTPAAETAGAVAQIPWANLMAQAGLYASGELTIDLQNFNNKMNLMQVSAATPEQKANISFLKAEAAIVFVQKTGAITAAIQMQQPPETVQASGIDIKAQLNKLYMTM